MTCIHCEELREQLDRQDLRMAWLEKYAPATIDILGSAGEPLRIGAPIVRVRPTGTWDTSGPTLGVAIDRAIRTKE